MKKWLFVFVLIPFLIGLISCGGDGGGDGVYYDPNKLFKLEDPNYYKQDYKESYSITGSDTGGGKYTGSFYFNTKDKIIMDTQLVIPIESLWNLTNTVKGASISILVTIYFNENKIPLKMVNSETDVIYIPTNISIYPETAKIGDFGSLSSWSGDDGSTITGTWVLENAPGGLANLVTMETMKDSFGNTTLYQELTMTIDENGYTSSVSLTWYYPDTEINVYLSGERTS